MSTYCYKTRGTCSREIRFDIVDGRVVGLEIIGGCEGNVEGLTRLVEGMRADAVISRLKGIDCEGKGTSCPDQLARALSEVLVGAADSAV